VAAVVAVVRRVHVLRLRMVAVTIPRVGHVRRVVAMGIARVQVVGTGELTSVFVTIMDEMRMGSHNMRMGMNLVYGFRVRMRGRVVGIMGRRWWWRGC
jgi:hypothetical protein